MGDKEAKIFVTKEEHAKFSSKTNDSQSQEAYDDYQKDYHNAMVEVHRQSGLRNRDVPIINPIKKINVNQHSSSNTNKTIVEKDKANKEHIEVHKGNNYLGEIVTKNPEIRKESVILRENMSSFNMENGISKIKIICLLVKF